VFNKETIDRIKASKKAVLSDLYFYLGSSVSHMNLKELSELNIVLTELDEETKKLMELLKDRMRKILES